MRTTDLAIVANRAKIMRLQGALQKMPPADMPVRHYFAQGVYAREAFIPKGVAFVGRLHLQSQINIISQGDISVFTERGLERFKAPHTFVAPAGAKRSGFTHEDTVWTAILGTEKTDPEDIFETLTALDYEQYERLLRDQRNGGGT